MKRNILGFITMIAIILFSGPSAHADGAITIDEQRILTELDQGVIIDGNSFTVGPYERVHAENYLKQNDLSADQVNKIVEQIQSARFLISSSGIVDVTNINSIEELIKALPWNVKNQLKDIISKTASILELTVNFYPGGYTITGTNVGSSSTKTSTVSTKKTIRGTVYSSGDAVKQTGMTYLSSAISFSSLLLVAAGAFVVGSKKFV